MGSIRRHYWRTSETRPQSLPKAVGTQKLSAYSGTEQSLDGNATGEQAGCAFHWKYTRNQIVGTHSPDAMIDCACEECNIIQGQEGIAAYWRRRFRKSPALELIDLQVDGGSVLVTYRTNTGIVEALLDIDDDGLITCCCCGPV